MLLSPGGGERKEMDRVLVERNQNRMKRNKEAGRSPRELNAKIGDKVKVKRTDGSFSEPVAIQQLDRTSVKLADARKWAKNKVGHRKQPMGGRQVLVGGCRK